jgi:hypothetical protein
MRFECSLVGCSDPTVTIHGGYAYCHHHLQMVWELPDSEALSGDQKYRAVLELTYVIDELFGGDDRWEWNPAMDRIAHDAVALARGEFTPPDGDFTGHAVSIWQEMTGTTPPRAERAERHDA